MRAVMREAPNSRPGFFRRCGLVGLNASVMLALAACGGGGGSDQPSAPQNPPTTPTNAAPSNVNAGADQTITLPTNSVSLQGSATDDGLPAPATLTYAWSTDSSGVTFSAANAAATTATFAAAGTYVLTLTVSDGALSATDTLQVIVNAADGKPEAGLIVSPTDPDKAKTLFTALGAFIGLGGGEQGITVRTEDHNGTTITIIDLGDAGKLSGMAGGDIGVPMLSGHLEIAYAVTDQIVVIGTGPAFVEHVLDTTAGTSLARDPQYSDLAAKAGPGTGSAHSTYERPVPG